MRPEIRRGVLEARVASETELDFKPNLGISQVALTVYMTQSYFGTKGLGWLTRPMIRLHTFSLAF